MNGTGKSSANIRQRPRMAQALIVLLCACLVALIGRLVYINTAMGEKLRSYSYERQTRTIVLRGCRGAILDRRYRVLAGSTDRFLVYADPQIVDHAEAATALSSVLGIPDAEILAKLERREADQYVVLWRGTENKRKQIADLKLAGVGIQREPLRTYPMGTLAAHLIGHVNLATPAVGVETNTGKKLAGLEIQGLDGIEKMCNARLKDTPGRRTVFCDGLRRAMFEEPDSYVAPTNGVHVVLTIDTNIQEKLEEQLKARVELHDAECAVGLVMNPKTGEILAMANYPTFDPAHAGNVPMKMLRNRVLTDPVEPGSAFKPFIMSAVLINHAARRTDVIDCHNGALPVGNKVLHDSHPYGALTVDQVLSKSSNIGMAILGMRMGNGKIYHMLDLFGFTEKTGVDLLGEDRGLVPPLKRWPQIVTPYVSMGQAIAVTPIQIATAFSSIINGGHLLRPRVVAAVVGDEGEIIEDHTATEERRQALDPDISHQMVEMCTKVVTEGTGKECKLDHWQALGKTGTAQLPLVGHKGYQSGAYLATFIGAAPASDPAAVVLIMVRHPKKNGYYGAQVSCPAVKEVLNFTLAYQNVPYENLAPGEVQVAMDGRSGASD